MKEIHVLLLTNEIVKAEQCASELAVAFHDDPDTRADASVNKFCQSNTFD